MSAEQVRIVRGAPDPGELAALVAVLCARARPPAPVTGYPAWRARRLAALRGAAPRP